MTRTAAEIAKSLTKEPRRAITDDEVWAAYDAAQKEAKAWRIIKWPDGQVEAVDDRRWDDQLYGEGVPLTAKYERVPFKDEATARRYIEWRSIKAALSVRAILQEQDNGR